MRAQRNNFVVRFLRTVAVREGTVDTMSGCQQPSGSATIVEERRTRQEMRVVRLF